MAIVLSHNGLLALLLVRCLIILLPQARSIPARCATKTDQLVRTDVKQAVIRPNRRWRASYKWQPKMTRSTVARPITGGIRGTYVAHTYLPTCLFPGGWRSRPIHETALQAVRNHSMRDLADLSCDEHCSLREQISTGFQCRSFKSYEKPSAVLSSR
jgi:hypothetical protein